MYERILTMSEAISYKTVRSNATDTELNEYRDCFVRNNSPRTIENLKWLHQENLLGENIIYNTISSDDHLAAIYTVLPVPFKVGQEVVKGCQSIDTITVPEHRGKGLFFKAAQELFTDIGLEGYKLVYGFPNSSSAHGFFNKLGWTSFGEVPFLIKPLRLSFILKKLFKIKPKPIPEYINLDASFPLELKRGKSIIKSIGIFDTTYDDFWTRLSQKHQICVNRSSAYLNWRYNSKPNEVYFKYGLYRDAELLAVAIFTIKNKHDGRIGYLMELLHDSEFTMEGKQLLKFASNCMRQAHADVILAWSLAHSCTHRSYLKAGFLVYPEMFRPQKLFWGVKVLQPELEPLALNLNNWYISYSDSDTV
jgi:hypothetical protein